MLYSDGTEILRAFGGTLKNSENLFYEAKFLFFWQMAESVERGDVLSSERAYTIKDIEDIRVFLFCLCP